jgi:hypothetical protein
MWGFGSGMKANASLPGGSSTGSSSVLAHEVAERVEHRGDLAGVVLVARPQGAERVEHEHVGGELAENGGQLVEVALELESDRLEHLDLGREV